MYVSACLCTCICMCACAYMNHPDLPLSAASSINLDNLSHFVWMFSCAMFVLLSSVWSTKRRWQQNSSCCKFFFKYCLFEQNWSFCFDCEWCILFPCRIHQRIVSLSSFVAVVNTLVAYSLPKWAVTSIELVTGGATTTLIVKFGWRGGGGGWQSKRLFFSGKKRQKYPSFEKSADNSNFFFQIANALWQLERKHRVQMRLAFVYMFFRYFFTCRLGGGLVEEGLNLLRIWKSIGNYGWPLSKTIIFAWLRASKYINFTNWAIQFLLLYLESSLCLFFFFNFRWQQQSALKTELHRVCQRFLPSLPTLIIPTVSVCDQIICLKIGQVPLQLHENMLLMLRRWFDLVELFISSGPLWWGIICRYGGVCAHLLIYLCG